MKTLTSVVKGVKNSAPSYVPSGRLSLPFFGQNNKEAQMRSMGSIGTVFSIVNKTSNGTAQVDWNLWRKSSSGKKEDRTPVLKHLALNLWNKPNDFYTQHEYIETFQQHIDLTGEGWWIIDKIGKIPVGLWCVRPDRMEPVPHPTKFISGYIYTGPNGEKVPFELDEVIQLKMPNPLDPYRGMGPVQSIMVDLDSTRYSAEWNRNFFLNGAEPGGVIEVPEKLEEPEFDDMTRRWREQHQGVNKAHRVAILENAKWVNTKFSQKDMEFTALREASREIIREAFGFPKPMLGAVDDVNRANAEAGEYVFGKWLIVPRCERIKDALNAKFLPMFGPSDYEFDYTTPVSGNVEIENSERDSKAAAAKLLIEAGFDPEETLTTVGLPPMKYNGLPEKVGAAVGQ